MGIFVSAILEKVALKNIQKACNEDHITDANNVSLVFVSGTHAKKTKRINLQEACSNDHILYTALIEC